MIFAVLTALLAGYTIYSRLMQGTGLSGGDVLNFVFLGIMALIVIMMSLGNLKRADKMTEELQNAVKMLKNGED